MATAPLFARWIALALATALVAVLALSPTGLVPRARAITVMQAEAPFTAPTAPPHDAVGGVVDADTAGGQTTATGPSPVFLLVAALGVLVGVFILTRPRRRGPD